MADTKERKSGAFLADRTIDELIDERIIIEELALRDNGACFSTRPRATMVFACCVASLAFALLYSASSHSKKGVQIYLAHAHHDVQNATVVKDPSLHFSNSTINALKTNSLIAEESDLSSSRQDVHLDGRAGTFICDYMSRIANFSADLDCTPETSAWTYNRSADSATSDHRFQILSWDAGSDPSSVVNLGDPHIVSIFIMQDPLRLVQAVDELLGGKHSRMKAAKVREEAKKIAKNHSTLGLLTGKSCLGGANATRSCFVKARSTLKKFTFVLNQACLADSVNALAFELELPHAKLGRSTSDHRDRRVRYRAVNTNSLTEYVLDQLQGDINLYEWSRSMSIVKC